MYLEELVEKEVRLTMGSFVPALLHFGRVFPVLLFTQAFGNLPVLRKVKGIVIDALPILSGIVSASFMVVIRFANEFFYGMPNSF